MIQLTTRNQWNPLWGSLHLGTAVKPDGTPVTMANSGCYTTSEAVILGMDPGDLCRQVNLIKGYDPGGMLEWDAIEKLRPDAFFYESEWTSNFTKDTNDSKVEIATAIPHLQRLVSLGFPVLLAVDHAEHDQWPDHAVVLYDAPDDLSKWKIKDPDGGLDIPFSNRYGDPMTGIYGYRTVLVCPTSWPDYSTRQMQNDGIAAWKHSQMYKAYKALPDDIRAKLPVEITTYMKETLDDILR